MRIDQLTFTRFIAAFFILVYHFGKKTFPFNWEPTWMIIKQTNVGVSYFYILSGYVMILAYFKLEGNKINWLNFYINRFARIYPVYIVAILLSVSFILFKGENFTLLALLLEIFCLQSWVPSYALEINYTAWSISNEVFFFLLFPFLLNRCYVKYSLPKIALWVICFWAASQIFFNLLLQTSFYKGYPSTSHEALYYHPFMHLNEFLIGNLAGILFKKKLSDINQTKNYDLPVLLLTVLLLIAMAHPLVNFHNGILALIFVPFIILLSLNNGIITRIFLKKIPVLLGEISYGFYILQMPVFWVCKFIYIKLGIDSSKYPLFYFGLIALLIVSYLSYVLFEKPMRQAIQEHLKRKVPFLTK